MNRGMFSDLAGLDAYRATKKDWFVTLDYSRCFWHEQTVNVINGFDCRKSIARELKELKHITSEQLDKAIHLLHRSSITSR